jgi:uncharacterized protein with GYD domain
MPKYLANFTYSSGSWAHLINTPEDRTAAAQEVVESLGGRLECVYWQMDSTDGLAIADFPTRSAPARWKQRSSRQAHSRACTAMS